MNNLSTYISDRWGSIRTLQENEKILFCGNDVARSLGYSNVRDALSRHCKGVVKRDTLTGGGMQTMTFLPEGDVYRLIAHSKLPGAEAFERWIFDEILPTIRKTGGYVADEDAFIRTYLPRCDEATQTLFRVNLRTIRDLNAKLDEAQPKVLFADAVANSEQTILVGDLAKLIKQNGVDVGQKRLFAWMRDHGYLCKAGSSINIPTQRAMDMKLFRVVENTILCPDGSSRVTRTTKVTGKGQEYFVHKILTEGL